MVLLLVCGFMYQWWQKENSVRGYGEMDALYIYFQVENVNPN